MQKILAAFLVMTTLPTATAIATESATLALPRDLIEAARKAGSPIESAEIVEGTAVGLFDRRGGRTLHVSRAALAAASGAEEKATLLAIILSYKIGQTPATRNSAARAADIVAGVVAIGMKENIAGRERADPYRKLPATPRDWQRQDAPPADRDPDPVAVRGLAWAKSAGVCQTTAITLLNKLQSMQATDGLLAFDARAVLKGLGFIRFNPESDCTHS